ncbi:Fc.00g037270.m01.CDS01 [Cosmosporella sp. VM-42]
MPSRLKKLKRSSRGFIKASAENKIARGDRGASDASDSAIISRDAPAAPDEEEGGGRRPSNRRPGDFLQGLLSRARRVTEGEDTRKDATPADRNQRRHNYDSNIRAPPPSSVASSSVASPRSPPDPNKPLPSPPPNPTLTTTSLTIRDSPKNSPTAQSSPATTSKKDANPVLKLDRIMATLTESEIEKLFSGAPQYFARSEGHCSGAPNASVAFPFDEELEIRDLTDHVQIEDKAWSGVTAWPHLTRDINHDAAARKKAEESQKAHFFIRCRERPNMLSMSGLEKGTMGYSAALELSVGDSLEEEQFGFESVGKKNQVIIEARERMLSSLGALRRLPETEILDRLKRNGELYRDNDLRKRKSVQTYQDLFHTFMRPINSVVDKRDHYSLTNQINALLKCLGTSNVWFDFTHVEWRIRLGQILWGEEDGDDLEDTSSIHDATSASERAEEKYWLLMQILVATELLIRLDAVTEGEEYGVEAFRPIDVVHFERAATKPVKWSLHLARSWLENIDVAKVEGTPPREVSPPRTPTSWLGSLVSKISFHHHHEQATPPTSVYSYTIRGRHGQRQADGLTHFAKKLRWPGIETYETRIAQNAQDSVGSASVPNPKTPIKAKRTSYFGQWDVSSGEGKYDRRPSQRRKLAAALHTSGWLSKSYVFGLMLPGEGLYHYLMATLLENDSEAMSKLGPYANLCGGFVYSGKSFWSTSCIVGRVIAAGKGSAECMGWVSSDILPVGLGDGWVNIEVEDVAEDMAHLGKKARLWAKKRIEKESSILGDADEKVLPADFIIPHENSYSTPPPRVDISLQTLELLAPANNIQARPFTPTAAESAANDSSATGRKSPPLLSYPANIHFAVSIDGGAPEEFSFSLSYDISFVTAHPCAPSQRVRFLKSPTSPTIQQIDVFGSENLANSRPAHRTGHPLHKYYNYTVIHISELLKRQHTPLSELLNSPTPNNPGYTTWRNGASRVLVIDCITNYAEVPMSPTLERLTSKYNIVQRRGSFPAAAQMHFESRKRQFGSDMEILVRALCAQKGWNAIISRRKRGCLACSIREAGALQWKVIVRVE